MYDANEEELKKKTNGNNELRAYARISINTNFFSLSFFRWVFFYSSTTPANHFKYNQPKVKRKKNTQKNELQGNAQAMKKQWIKYDDWKKMAWRGKKHPIEMK